METAGLQPAACLTLAARAAVKAERLQVASELFAEGESTYTVARKCGVSRTQARFDRIALGLPPLPSGRRPGLRAREGGRILREKRRAAGLSQNRLAKAAGTDASTISRLEGQWDYGVYSVVAERIATCLGAPLDDVFTSRRPPLELRGHRSRPAARARERYAPTSIGEAFEACQAYCESHGLWTVEEFADLLLLSETVVDWYVRRNLIPIAETRQFGSLRFRLFRIDDVKRFARERWGMEPRNGLAQLHRDPQWVYTWARAHDWTHEQAKLLSKRVVERQRLARKIRTGVRHAEERHRRWLELWLQLRKKYLDEDPSRLIADVALFDWQRHPEDWPRDKYPARKHDPHDFADGYVRRDARERVRKALLRL